MGGQGSDMLGRGEWAFALLVALFTSSLVISNVTASKLVSVEFPRIGVILFPSAVLAYALTFAFTDIIGEVWGKEKAKTVVAAGLGANVLALLLVMFSVSLPAPAFQQDFANSFNLVFSFSPGIIIASIVAYLVSQFNDVILFHRLKEATGGKFLWLRNNLSTLTSQLLDTFIFISLAFYVLPKIVIGAPIIPLHEILRLISGQYMLKAIIALADTPLVYGMSHLIRKMIS